MGRHRKPTDHPNRRGEAQPTGLEPAAPGEGAAVGEAAAYTATAVGPAGPAPDSPELAAGPATPHTAAEVLDFRSSSADARGNPTGPSTQPAAAAACPVPPPNPWDGAGHPITETQPDTLDGCLIAAVCAACLAAAVLIATITTWVWTP